MSKGLVPHHGIVAGSSTATFEFKGYCIPTVNNFLEQGFSTDQPVHVDDFSLNERCADMFKCVHNMALAL
eukprot:4534950-Pyramimonas_sp.AAC.1